MVTDIIAVCRLSELKIGQKALITSFTDDDLSLKLLEMGCLPGTKIIIENVAPLGCPVCIRVNNNNQLAIRKSEAKTIIVTVL